eukprot:NODE_6151_length_1700_cov_10.187540.p1 GENE.NODE_6151_length_1700_cov_10.187540~~NODE_6151_length_1700_cov_10.187540.p1  ORF type:complete len:426 (-),score=76.34 NODE_6151_length_1700_cov_10.187540:421-1551(-)
MSNNLVPFDASSDVLGPKPPDTGGGLGEGKGSISFRGEKVAVVSGALRVGVSHEAPGLSEDPKTVRAPHCGRRWVDQGEGQALCAVTVAVSYAEVQQWVNDLKVEEEVVSPGHDQLVHERRCFCLPTSRWRGDIPGLDHRLHAEKNRVLFLQQTPFDDETPMHLQMLRTIYSKLTRNDVCPAVGQHWEDIGFHSSSPKVDLSTGGILCVLHLFDVFSQHLELLKLLHQLSRHERQGFPLALFSIRMTQMVTEALLAGRLSSLCNRGRSGVLATTCRVHAAGLWHCHSQWRTCKRTIGQSEQTFGEIWALMMRKPKKLVLAFERGLEEQRARLDASRLQYSHLEFSTTWAAPPQPGTTRRRGGNWRKRLPRALQDLI